MNRPVWAEIEETLLSLYALPHNQVALRQAGAASPQAAVKQKLEAIRSGIAGVPRKEEFTGPALFLRVAGPSTRGIYSGEWWFEASLLDSLEKAHSRIYFQSADRKAALAAMLRELLAVTREWNAMTEVWALELPAGEKLVGFSGPGSPQKLFQNLPLTDKANRMLVGRAKQIYFPVKNPLWVKIYSHLA